MENERTLKIYFGSQCANLYTVGYVSADLFQLLTLCNLIENRQTASLRKYYVERKGLFLSRYSKIFKENVRSSQIKHVKEGSVEIIIGCVSLIAVIVIPFVVQGVQHRLDRNNQSVTFNVSVEDPGIKDYMDLFENHQFGYGENGLRLFIDVLSVKGYNVTALSEHIYEVAKIAEGYTKRIARTIKINY